MKNTSLTLLLLAAAFCCTTANAGPPDPDGFLAALAAAHTPVGQEPERLAIPPVCETPEVLQFRAMLKASHVAQGQEPERQFVPQTPTMPMAGQQFGSPATCYSNGGYPQPGGMQRVPGVPVAPGINMVRSYTGNVVLMDTGMTSHGYGLPAYGHFSQLRYVHDAGTPLGFPRWDYSQLVNRRYVYNPQPGHSGHGQGHGYPSCGYPGYGNSGQYCGPYAPQPPPPMMCGPWRHH